MASQQAYQAYAQHNKGTLVPGQTISVNKYTVQVERYLSQGGFAHVYLVRTPTPVYNTTHHVLKRIAVANESMLSEVKREVDVMRVLKGHPNIVHLIDAAWHRLPNGTYEVFILMEFCPGGGIIDMMNRRLRERLTEAEILQIFVDVCEGVAFMHNSRPALLHRDLKVENILQSSATSYKLCDFGSATTVQRPPTNTQEIRALEADLGRHTTMQYRSPEMIDLYSKRPIDEKSDIWALGVLLYKLCYYTTPFEEHGSLAILNVQYRIPPYPVYSSQMNMLIGSMLREHGSQRPTVFELLKHVHHLRGTKSAFNYNIPVQQPLVPRQPQIPSTKPAPSPNLLNHGSATNIIPRQNPNPLRSAPVSSGSPPKNQGVQARDKVLEAIAPMRRGRPSQAREGSSSRQPSPQKNGQPKSNSFAPLPASGSKELNWLDKEEASLKTNNAQSEARERAMALFDEAWKVPGSNTSKDTDVKSPATGFGDDFAEKLWRAPNPNTAVQTPPRISPKPTSHGHSASAIIKPLSHTGGDHMRSGRDKDAFEGLGLMTSIGKPAPTLAEARKLRTGLAIMSSQTNHYNNYKQPEPSSKPSGNPGSARPTPSPRPTYLTTATNAFQGSSRSPTPNPDSWRGPPQATSVSPPASSNSVGKDGMPIESRFPSLEELDAQFSATSLYPGSAQDTGSRFSSRQQPQASPAASLYPASAQGGESRFTGRQQAQTTSTTTPALPPRPIATGNRGDIDRPSRMHGLPSAPATFDSLEKKLEAQSVKHDWKPSPSPRGSGESNAEPSRAQGGSATMRYALQDIDSKPSSARSYSSTNPSMPDRSTAPASPSKQPRQQQRDWLTGDNEFTNIEKSSTGPIVRDMAAKRTSVVIQSDFKLQDPVVPQYGTTPVMKSETTLPPEESPTVARFTKTFPAIDTSSPSSTTLNHNEPLSDNWSPIASSNPPPELPPKSSRRKEPEPASSADEDGPEDLGGLATPAKKGSVRPKHKARQSSVHELVDLWGGSVPKEKGNSPLLDTIPLKPALVEKPALRVKPRPTSLLPPGRGASITGRSVSGSPRISPIQRDPSPKMTPSPLDTSFTPLSSAVTPTSGRARPQSMLIFPSKSSDNLGSRAMTLAPPPEEDTPRRPAARKTSISDMVNRYEAIGGKVITPQQVAPAPVTRKPSFTRNTNIPPTQAEVGRVKVLPVADKPVLAPKDAYRPGRISESTKPRTRALSTGPIRAPLEIPRTSAKPQQISPIEKRSVSPKKIAASSSRPSHKQPESSNTVVFPKRKATLPSAEELTLTSPTSSTSDDRSSSPERPFQGVGKLIDQWQRKTEQNDGFARPPAKRAGLVPGNRG